MKKLIIYTFTILFSNVINAQVYTLNKTVNLDTLHLSVESSDKFESDLSTQLIDQVKKRHRPIQQKRNWVLCYLRHKQKR